MKEQDQDGAVDMTGIKPLQAQTPDPLEKEEREAAKKNAAEAPKGDFIVLTNIKVDGKAFKRGDAYNGKLYNDLISSKSICKKSEWVNR